jgi:hypothetical protein
VKVRRSGECRNDGSEQQGIVGDASELARRV